MTSENPVSRTAETTTESEPRSTHLGKDCIGHSFQIQKGLFGERKPMAKAYWVQTYRSSAKNTEAWEAYRKLAAPALTAAGGRYLVRNKPAKTYEAGINERVILIEFDSLEKAIAARSTPAYQEALEVLGTGNVERDIRLVEGE